MSCAGRIGRDAELGNGEALGEFVVVEVVLLSAARGEFVTGYSSSVHAQVDSTCGSERVLLEVDTTQKV